MRKKKHHGDFLAMISTNWKIKCFDIGKFGKNVTSIIKIIIRSIEEVDMNWDSPFVLL